MPDGARIAARLDALWEIARGPGGGADRPAFSQAEAEAMRIVAGWAQDAGLDPGLDRHGNLWALPPGWDGPLVTSGSHVDTVPDGGRYDGALGTVLALELAHELRAGTPGGTRPALLVCAAEEAPRFGTGTIGSRCLAGTLTEAAFGELRDAAGVSAAQARADYRELVDLPELEAPLGAAARPCRSAHRPTSRAEHTRRRRACRRAAPPRDRAARQCRPRRRGVDGGSP